MSDTDSSATAQTDNNGGWWAPTVTAMIERRADDAGTAVIFEDRRWTWRDYVAECRRYARWMVARRRDGPFHVGVLMDNRPEYLFALGAAALCGATVVGINSTRRGAELARDISHTDCQILLFESSLAALLPPSSTQTLGACVDVDDAGFAAQLDAASDIALPAELPGPDHVLCLVFTSGTTGAPKAVKMSQGRLAASPAGSDATLGVVGFIGLTPDDVCYSCMPLFHSNALITSWIPAVAVGATLVVRRRFSASGLLRDIREYGVTYFNYVGKALAYLLAQPEQPDDGALSLTRLFGNEASAEDVAAFARRFNCQVYDGYGSTEGGVVLYRTADTPPGALGVAPSGTVGIIDAETGIECPRARIDAAGRLLNPGEAIGEIVNLAGAPGFEGYYNNERSTREKLRGGKYWTGDLGYRDEAGFFWFAGRDSDWLRVDGENFAAAPIENILLRFEPTVTAAVYAVPDEIVGDQVMTTLTLRNGQPFDPAAFDTFLAGCADLGTKWRPRYVRIAKSSYDTVTMKTVRRRYAADFWECADPVWWRPERSAGLQPLTDDDRAALRRRFAGRGREHLLDALVARS